MTPKKFIRGPLWGTLVAALVAAMMAAFFVFVQSGEAAQVADEQFYEPSIIGGTAVPNGKYPFIAALIDTRIQGNTPLDQQFCGGTLIDKNSVLTAGHCVADDAAVPSVQPLLTAPLRVIVGRTVLNSSQGQIRNVKRIFVHPGFTTSGSVWFDAAVLELWESTMAAEGSGLRPARFLSAACKARRTRCHNPLRRNLRKW